MTLYSTEVFFHILGAVGLFIGYGLEWIISSLFRRAATVAEARSWLRVYQVSPPLTGIGLLVVILTGGHLASISGTMREGWIPATLLGIALALALGFAVILPRIRAIRAAVATGDELSAAARSALSGSALATAIRMRACLAAGIVYLMGAKLPFTDSLIALAAALFAGMLLSMPVWSSAGKSPAS